MTETGHETEGPATSTAGLQLNKYSSMFRVGPKACFERGQSEDTLNLSIKGVARLEQKTNDKRMTTASMKRRDTKL